MQDASLTTHLFSIAKKSHISPVQSLILIALTIFWSEVAVMVIIYFFPVKSAFIEWFLDAALLLLLLSPVIYFFIYKPFQLGLQERIESNRALEESHRRVQTVFTTSPDAIVVSRFDDGLITEVNEAFTKITGYNAGEAIGKTTIQLGIWNDNKDRDKMLADLSKNKQLYNFEAAFRHKEGGIFPGLLSAQFTDLGDERHIISVVRNIDVLKKAERKITAANRFLKIANENRVVETIVKAFTRAIKELTDSQAVGVMIPGEKEIFSFAFHLGYDEISIDEDVIKRIENSQKEIFLAYKNGRNKPDFNTWRKFRIGSHSEILTDNNPETCAMQFYEACRTAGLESLSLIPIYGENELMGLVHIADTRTDCFTDDVITTIEFGALQLGMAIERAFIHEELEQYSQKLAFMVEERTEQLKMANDLLKKEIEEKNQSEQKLLIHKDKMRELTTELLNAQERERKKLAVELHDSIGHNLAIVKMELNSLLPNCKKEKPTIDKIISTISQMMQETRSMSFSLSPPSLNTVGIGAALEDLCEKTMEEHDLQVLFRESIKNLRLDESYRFLIFSIARELIFNVVKHARARKLTVEIGEAQGFVTLKVQDDGVGFDVSALEGKNGKGSGFGLFGTHERVAALGGEMDLGSTTGSGTVVIVKVPVK